MPKKKKVKKAAVKVRSKKKEALQEQTIQPIATRELPPQPEVKEVTQPEVKEAVVEAEAESAETPAMEEPEHKESHKQVIIGESIEFGWKAVKSHLGFFIGIFLLFGALSFMVYGAEAFGTRIVLGLLVTGISLGFIKIAVDMADKKAPEFKELFSCFSLLLKYVVASALYAVVVAVGLVLFVIPGIIWAVQFGFYPYVIVKERLGPLSALRKSSELTAGVKGRLIMFALCLLGINLLGVVALGLGVIITVPLSLIAAAHVFHQLEKQHI